MLCIKVVVNVIGDQQGNARVSFQDNGSGVAVVKQENSYYTFGLVMPNSPVGTPTTPNKQLYNGGSEWQNDYNNLPDYYQTFNRNYDAALGRFIGVDPMAEGDESMTTYQYAGNNPVMFNDPLGNMKQLPPPAEYVRTDNPNPASAMIQSDGNSFFANADAVEDQLKDMRFTSFMMELDMAGTAIKMVDGIIIGKPGSNTGGDSNNGDNNLHWNPFGGGTITRDEYLQIPGHSENTPEEGGDYSPGAWEIQGGDPYAYAGNLYHLPINSLPLNDGSFHQNGPLCTFCSMAAARNFYGDHTTDREVLRNYSSKAKLSGAALVDIKNIGYVGDLGNLYATSLNGYFSDDVLKALVNGNPVLGTFFNSKFGHEVVITGFSYYTKGSKPGFNYSYFDPMTGTYNHDYPSAFHETYVVTGIH